MSPHPIQITHCLSLSLFLSELWEIGVVIAVQCNGHEGHCSTVFRVRAMTSSGAHENGLKQKLANLLETIGHGSPLVGGAYNAQKGMNSWVTFFGLRGAAIVRYSQHVCLRVVTMRSPDHPSTMFHRDSSASKDATFVSFSCYNATNWRLRENFHNVFGRLNGLIRKNENCVTVNYATF